MDPNTPLQPEQQPTTPTLEQPVVAAAPAEPVVQPAVSEPAAPVAPVEAPVADAAPVAEAQPVAPMVEAPAPLPEKKGFFAKLFGKK